MKRKAELEIIWRNPRASLHQRRWEQINRDSKTISYLVQEYIFTSAGAFWMTTSSLEVLPGGRVA